MTAASFRQVTVRRGGRSSVMDRTISSCGDSNAVEQKRHRGRQASAAILNRPETLP
jgi:hypothetical protein